MLIEGSGPATGSNIPIQAANLTLETDRVEVVLRNGRLLRFGSTLDPDSVARLAATLER